MLIRWQQPIAVSLKYVIIVPVVALLVGATFGPGLQHFAQRTNIIESGYQFLAELVASSRPSWWENIFQLAPQVLLGWCAAVVLLSASILYILLRPLLQSAGKYSGCASWRGQQGGAKKRWFLNRVFVMISGWKSIWLRMLMAVLFKDLATATRSDGLVLRKAYLVFLAGLALGGLGLGVAGSLGGGAGLAALWVVAGGVLTG